MWVGVLVAAQETCSVEYGGQLREYSGCFLGLDGGFDLYYKFLDGDKVDMTFVGEVRKEGETRT